MPAKIGSFKGKPTLTLKRAEADPDAFGFTFGIAKAELILQHLDEIKRFAASSQIEQPIDFKAGA
jgi:hypothetical protein